MHTILVDHDSSGENKFVANADLRSHMHFPSPRPGRPTRLTPERSSPWWARCRGTEGIGGDRAIQNRKKSQSGSPYRFGTLPFASRVTTRHEGHPPHHIPTRPH